MVAYTLNREVSDEELSSIRASIQKWDADLRVECWPTVDANLPGDITIAIIIVRSHDSKIEHDRAIRCIDASIRLMCIYLEEVDEVSDIVKKYCSVKIGIGSGALGEALGGSDNVQEASDGSAAKKNPQKPHNC